MRAIVIGSDGLIGRSLAAALEAQGHSVVRTSRRKPSAERGAIPLDLADPEGIEAKLPSADVAFFCAGVTRFAECRSDPVRSELVNVTAPATLAARLAADGARPVLLSTSAVLDCREPRMLPSRPYAPRGIYGRQKAAAEQRFLGLGARASVLRLTKVITPDARLLGDWLKELSRSRPIRAYTDLRISPLRVSDVISAAVAVGTRGAGGIYQVSGDDDVSYAEIAHRLAARSGASDRLVEEGSAIDDGIPADEVTPYTSLDVARLAALSGFKAPSAFAVIDEMFPGTQV